MRGGFRPNRYTIDPFKAAKKDAENKRKEIEENAVRDLDQADQVFEDRQAEEGLD